MKEKRINIVRKKKKKKEEETAEVGKKSRS